MNFLFHTVLLVVLLIYSANKPTMRRQYVEYRNQFASLSCDVQSNPTLFLYFQRMLSRIVEPFVPFLDCLPCDYFSSFVISLYQPLSMHLRFRPQQAVIPIDQT